MFMCTCCSSKGTDVMGTYDAVLFLCLYVRSLRLRVCVCVLISCQLVELLMLDPAVMWRSLSGTVFCVVPPWLLMSVATVMPAKVMWTPVHISAWCQIVKSTIYSAFIVSLLYRECTQLPMFVSNRELCGDGAQPCVGLRAVRIGPTQFPDWRS